MIIGPKYKICKRLGSAVFEKCQTQKFALVEARASDAKRGGRRPSPASDYKRQLIEKQKLRFMYGLSEGQLARYVREAVEHDDVPRDALMRRLEARLDNVVYRLGLAKTRRQARQMVSHRHVTVNGRKVTVPSYTVTEGETLAIREGSRDIGLLAGREEELQTVTSPAWLTFDAKALAGSVSAAPSYDPTELLFDLEQVLEYYSR